MVAGAGFVDSLVVLRVIHWLAVEENNALVVDVLFNVCLHFLQRIENVLIVGIIVKFGSPVQLKLVAGICNLIFRI